MWVIGWVSIELLFALDWYTLLLTFMTMRNGSVRMGIDARRWSWICTLIAYVMPYLRTQLTAYVVVRTLIMWNKKFENFTLLMYVPNIFVLAIFSSFHFTLIPNYENIGPFSCGMKHHVSLDRQKAPYMINVWAI